MTPTETVRCRALIGGFGRPGMRDLDFGRQVVECLQQLEWPEGVVVEDLSCSAPLVLHRLQELRPAKVVLVGAVARDLDVPGTLRRYPVDLTPPDPREVHRSVEESVMGLVDLDHTLAMARHWGGLPADTTVIEVEPADASFGIGFSEQLARRVDSILEMVRAELAELADFAGQPRDFPPEDFAFLAPDRGDVCDEPAGEVSPRLSELRSYADQHEKARRHSDRGSIPGTFPGVALVGKFRPWGVFCEIGGDWVDAVPLADGAVGIAVGSVVDRGVEGAAAMTELRAAVRAYAVLEGHAPARLVHSLDRLAETTGLGRQAKLLYLTLQPRTGEVTFSSAGSCPPLILGAGVRGGRFLDPLDPSPLGTRPTAGRREATVRVPPGATVLLFTSGLVRSRTVSPEVGMERLLLAAADGSGSLDELCEHVLARCTDGLRRDDDICLLGIRLMANVVAQPAPAEQRAC